MQLSGAALAAERGGRRVFSGIDFSVGGGEMLAVTGPNGAGKSTLLRIVAGLLRPAAGSVRVEPEPEAGLSSAVHYFGHLDALKASLTVADNLGYWRRLYGGNGDIESALGRVGLAHLVDLPVGRLSAGQKRRVALARLIVSERPVWLLDEPATALDADAEAMLGLLIAGHLAGGGLVMAATHRPLPAAPSATLRLGSSP
ncbi:MAG TPA: heme ABC exporter ATP-binding protein CcmA [Bauldia sp.]|nr:heme ABC exporter ATP-binding protein CcmA [Bauldia sp.]